MKKIIEVIDSINDFSDCHFSIVSCNKEQYYYNVSMVNPVLVVVLRGEEIINNCDVVSPGQFIFLSKKSFCEYY
jgi:hypothetical protein